MSIIDDLIRFEKSEAWEMYCFGDGVAHDYPNLYHFIWLNSQGYRNNSVAGITSIKWTLKGPLHADHKV